MNVSPVRIATYIVRCQVEYSRATQAAVLRSILETPATGQRQGFSDAEALLTALRAALVDRQKQTTPPPQDIRSI